MSDLLTPVLGSGGKLEHAFDDIRDENRVLPFPHQRLTRLQRPTATDRVQRLQFFTIK